MKNTGHIAALMWCNEICATKFPNVLSHLGIFGNTWLGAQRLAPAVVAPSVRPRSPVLHQRQRVPLARKRPGFDRGLRRSIRQKSTRAIAGRRPLEKRSLFALDCLERLVQTQCWQTKGCDWPHTCPLMSSWGKHWPSLIQHIQLWSNCYSMLLFDILKHQQRRLQPKILWFPSQRSNMVKRITRSSAQARASPVSAQPNFAASCAKASLFPFPPRVNATTSNLYLRSR